MLGVEWTNVQAPVREMFTAMSKAMKEQSRDMAKILSRMDSFVTRDDALHHAYPRKDGCALEKSKASVEAMRALEDKVDECQQQMAKMAAIMQHQTTAITDLNFRLERSQRLVEELLEEQSQGRTEAIHTYVDDSVQQLRKETHAALIAKRDAAAHDVPPEVAAAIRSLQSDLKSHEELCENNKGHLDSAVSALRDDNAALQQQVQAVQVAAERGLAASEALTRQTAQEALMRESKEVGERLAATEHGLSALDKQLRAALQDSRNGLAEDIRRGVRDELERSTMVTARQAEAMVARILESKNYEQCFGDASVSDVRRIVEENNAMQRSQNEKDASLLRRELQLQQQEEQQQWFEKFEARIENITGSFDLLRSDVGNERTRIHDLSVDVQRALKKKADTADVRALVRGKDIEGAPLAEDAGGRNATVLHLREMDSKMADVSAELAKLRKICALVEHWPTLKTDMKSKLDAQQVEALLVDRLASALGKPVPEVKVDNARRRRTSARVTEDDESPRYNWKGLFADVGGRDWKAAVSELGASLRAALSEKINRSDCVATILSETHGTTNAITALKDAVSSKADHNAFQKVEHMVRILHERVVSELTCGLWLWTSRQLVGTSGSEQQIPWDSEAVNAAPSSLLWRQGTTEITVKLPGLYRVGVAVFTSLPVVLSVCVNGEPILALDPKVRPDRMPSSVNPRASLDERYLLRRLRHSAGDVTGVSLDEPVSLPANAVLSVTFQSATSSQAYLSVRKL